MFKTPSCSKKFQEAGHNSYMDKCVYQYHQGAYHLKNKNHFMQKFLTVGFWFCEKLYHSIIMVKKENDCNIYQITVMNGDLEHLLHGNRIIKEVDGVLHLEVGDIKQQEELKVSIGEALSRLLQLPLKKILKYYDRK